MFIMTLSLKLQFQFIASNSRSRMKSKVNLVKHCVCMKHAHFEECVKFWVSLISCVRLMEIFFVSFASVWLLCAVKVFGLSAGVGQHLCPVTSVTPLAGEGFVSAPFCLWHCCRCWLSGSSSGNVSGQLCSYSIGQDFSMFLQILCVTWFLFSHMIFRYCMLY